MNILLDALELLSTTMQQKKTFGIVDSSLYSSDDVDGLFQSLDNSSIFVEEIK